MSNFSENALKVLEKRYLRRNENGELSESPEGLFRRVAKAIAEVDYDYHNFNAQEMEEKFYQLMIEGLFMPNSPTLMNAGTPLGQLSACFVLPVGDSMEEIFEALKHAAIIHKTGGGTGFSFSKLRPKGDIVKSTGQIASGPVSFMKVFNSATEAVKQGGRRRGANMGILRVDHPDIMEFVTCKDDVTEITNFNISVTATDRFMECLKSGTSYELLNPRTGEVVQTVSAKEVFDKIVEQAWKNGEPGMVFIDKINKTHTLKDGGEIEATNPCVSGDTWVITSEGPFQVKDIHRTEILLALNGRFNRSDSKGFFETGIKPVLKIKTKRGYEIEVTEEHLMRVAKRVTENVVHQEWKKAGELKPGDKVILSNNRGLRWRGKGTLKEGYLLGLLLGDGTLKEEGGIIKMRGEDKETGAVIEEAEQSAFSLRHRSDFKGFQKTIPATKERRLRLAGLRDMASSYEIYPGNKKITQELEKTSSDFHIGFLRGFFDAEGKIIGSHKKGIAIRLWHKEIEGLKILQRMLHRLGIVSTIYENRKRGYKGYGGHDLVISRDNLKYFLDIIGFGDSRKREKLIQKLKKYRRKLYRERFLDRVKECVKLKKEKVYDIRIPGENAFDADGFYVHNCGEKPLLPYESCNLGSINLSKFYRGTPWYLERTMPATWEEVKNRIDWNHLKEVVHLSVHFLDNVIDANQYPLRQIEEMTKLNRKIGLGVMGFADLLYLLGIPYSTSESLKAAQEVMKFIQENADRKSHQLGEMKEPFPNIDKSIFKGTKRRNSVVTTIAPTGTISMIADTSAGIEPNFSLVYIKRVMEGEELLYVNKFLESASEELGFYSKELMMNLTKVPTLKPFEEIPQHIREIFETTFDISPEQHVRIQAAFQRHTEDAVSKTINLPEKATKEDVAKAYMLAYDLGCKGITIYRHGSRPSQVYDTGTKREQKFGHVQPRPRPKVVTGRTYKMRSGLGTLYITINQDEEGLHEVFVQLGKSGGCSNALTEAIGRLISLALRSGVSPSSVVKQLKGIRCASVVWENAEVYLSCPDTIAKTLEKHLLGGEQLKIFAEGKKKRDKVPPNFAPSPQNHKATGEICPDCGGVLVMMEDCATCLSCGFSKCD